MIQAYMLNTLDLEGTMTSMIGDAEQYRQAFDLDAQTINQVQAIDALNSIWAKIDPTFHDDNVDCDQSQNRISANPHGGSRLDQLHALSYYSTAAKEAVEWSSYHVHANVPSSTSTEEINIDFNNTNGGPSGARRTRFVADQTNRDAQGGTLTGWDNWCKEGLIDTDLCTILFVYWDPTAASNQGAWKPSFYQPHLFTDGDSYSAKVLTRHRHGYMTGAETDSLSMGEMHLPLALGGDGEVNFHIAAIEETRLGTYGTKGGGRLYHDLMFSVAATHDSSDSGYAGTHAVGNVACQVLMLGLNYDSNQAPLDGSDFWVVGASFNNAIKKYDLLGSSLQILTGSSNTLKDFNFTVPSTKVIYDSVQGMGWDPVHGSGTITGRPFIKESSPDSVWKVSVPSGSGGSTSVQIMSLPAYNTNFKLWSWILTDAGCAVQAGRYQSLDVNDVGIEASVPGPLWINNRPQISANMRFTFSGASTHLIPRYTFRVSRS